MKGQPKDYIPIDRNHLAIQMGSTARRDKFTRADFEKAIAHIEIALNTNPIILPKLKYSNKLYPAEAALILQLSRTRH